MINKEKIKKIKVIYYPYKLLKKSIYGIDSFLQAKIIEWKTQVIPLKYIVKNKKKVRKKIKNKEPLNVVFVVQYIPGWNKLEPVYTKMKNDDRFNPVIVCVPLNIQNHQLMDDKGNDTYRYFKEHGYEAIDALNKDGSWCDLKQLNPDYLFHSRPYNYFMPKEYTSGEIVKYALICNILYGPNLSTHGQDLTLNRDYFKDCYCYYAFDSTEQEFYENRFKLGIILGIQKCFPFGAIAIEQILSDKKEVTTKNFTKTVMWTPRWSTDPYIGGSTFFLYYKTIKKLAEDNPDVFFIFRPHPLMLDNFLKTGEMTIDEVNDFRDYCLKKSNVVLDEEKEYAEQLYKADILITDGSGMIPEYYVLGKPIIFCADTQNFVLWSKQLISSCYEIKNEKELIAVFYALKNGVDSKFEERGKTISKLFPNSVCNSDNILNTMYS